MKTVVSSITDDESSPPYRIPAGGSSPVGSIGFVNAGFELAAQIQNRELPMPDALFVTFGTMGTVAGLTLGLKAAGISCKVHAIRVVPDYVGSFEKCMQLIEQTNKLLHDHDQSFPILSITPNDLTVYGNYFGNGYGIPTRQGEAFINTIRNTDNIHLDSTYTGKCGAAFYDYISTEKNTTVLLWNTKNAHQDPTLRSTINYHDLPAPFHKYFA
jgi:D-cysteine desulfhydrase